MSRPLQMSHMKSVTTSRPEYRSTPAWRKWIALVLVVLMASPPVVAKGPGRAGVDALVEEPDAMAPQRANSPANVLWSTEQTQKVNDATVSGVDFGVTGQLDISVSEDAVAGGPPQMSYGKPVYSAAGELIIPLLGVAPNKKVNGVPTVPAVRALVGRVDLIPPLRALKSVEIPPVPDMNSFVVDKKSTVALGKALFWEARVGSDGNACASCHFAAGADNRLKNQLSPGLKAGDHTFSRNFQPAAQAILNSLKSLGLTEPGHRHKRTATGGGGANYTLLPEDFPFHRLTDPLDRNSAILFETDDVVSSHGTFAGDLIEMTTSGTEKCQPRPLDEFSVGGVLLRKVAPRNSPTVINAVFNYRNFWDGRANNVFNGVNPFGQRDPNARVLDMRSDGSVVPVKIAIPNASLASQAVGPTLSDFEMTCSGHTFKLVGKKVLPMRALASQAVHPKDSVLAAHVSSTGVGLTSTYAEMIKKAFHPRWWAGQGSFEGYTQMESNFSLFWGLAIMMYESTLVSDEAPVDKFLGWSGQPGDLTALGVQERRGLAIFREKGKCVSCHKGAEFTGAATGLQPSRDTNLTEQMFVGLGQIGMYDNGFYNIGVRPTEEDLGVGELDPWGQPLSFSRQFLDVVRGKSAPDAFQVRPCLFAVMSDGQNCWNTPDPDMTRTGVDGAFKTPTLRNVSLTRPYFHNGSRLTLEQVVEFYNRGGDRRGPDGNDTTGFTGPKAPGGGASNSHPNVRPLNLTDQEQKDLVAFLRNGLTDQRVACQQAPFDHPALRLTNGHTGNHIAVQRVAGTNFARDDYIDLPAVGAAGLPAGECLKHDNNSRISSPS